VFSYKKHKDNSQTADFCARVKGRLEVVTERLKLHSKIWTWFRHHTISPWLH